MTADREHIRPAIVVEIKTGGAPLQKSHCRCDDAGSKGNIAEVKAAIIPEKRGVLIFEIGDMDRKAASVVVIARIHTHTRHFAPVLTYGRARNEANVREVPVAIVTIKIIWGRIVGNEQVRPPIVIQVTPQDPEAIVAGGVVYAGGLGHLGEGPVSFVVIQTVAHALHSARPALHGDTTITTGRTNPEPGQSMKIELDVPCEHQIHKAIAIVIGKSRSRCPTGVR